MTRVFIRHRRARRTLVLAALLRAPSVAIAAELLGLPVDTLLDWMREEAIGPDMIPREETGP